MLSSLYWARMYEEIISRIRGKGLYEIDEEYDAPLTEQIYQEMKSDGIKVTKLDFFRLLGIRYNLHGKKLRKSKQE